MKKARTPNPKFDTQVSASLVDSSTSSVPFHGLLNDNGKLNLVRCSTTNNANKLYKRNSHPADDAMSEPSNPNLTIVKGVVMTLPYTIIVSTPSATKSVQSAIEPVFRIANETLNGWNPDSEVSTLNNMPPEKKTSLSTYLGKVLDIVDTAHDMTDGRYDPTTGSLSAAFENCIKDRQRPPQPSEIAPLKHSVGWKRRIVRTENTIARLNGHTLLDLDGISKGFVIDRLVDALLTAGFADCYVDWAGDVRAVGSHPDDRPWRSAIVRPPNLPRVFSHWQKQTLKDMLTNDDIAYFANLVTTGTNGCAMATSGDYFSIQKYGYHHIARVQDMTVLKASQRSIGSVCVLAKTCALADAIATAAMTFDDAAESAEFLEMIESRNSELVFGHCVMGRHPSRSERIERFSRRFITTAGNVDDGSQAAGSSAQDASTSDFTEESKEIVEQAGRLVYQSTGTLQFDGKSVKIDSLVSCSMNPRPLVTFTVPCSFVANASESADVNQNKLRYIALRAERRSMVASGVRVELRFAKIHRIGKVAFVCATVEDVDFGNVDECIAAYSDLTHEYRVSFDVKRSQFPLIPPLRKAKTLLRHVPSHVWVVTAISADQTRLALTATSVNVPCEGDGLITFNVTHTSAFYAGLGGAGSAVQLYALSMDLMGIARKFASECQPTEAEICKLEAQSILALSCSIERSENIQDHLMVIARACDMRLKSDKPDVRRPLVWLAGDYVSW